MCSMHRVVTVASGTGGGAWLSGMAISRSHVYVCVGGGVGECVSSYYLEEPRNKGLRQRQALQPTLSPRHPRGERLRRWHLLHPWFHPCREGWGERDRRTPVWRARHRPPFLPPFLPPLVPFV
jgi:hypothetical protein